MGLVVVMIVTCAVSLHVIMTGEVSLKNVDLICQCSSHSRAPAFPRREAIRSSSAGPSHLELEKQKVLLNDPPNRFGLLQCVLAARYKWQRCLTLVSSASLRREVVRPSERTTIRRIDVLRAAAWFGDVKTVLR